MTDLIDASDTRLLVSLGWVCSGWRNKTRKTDRAAQAWKKACAALMIKRGELTSESIHRRDLSLTTRSRCYTANENGYFVPHGGNGSDRCTNNEHYYLDSLRAVFPKPHPKLSDYMHWTLARLALKAGTRIRQRQALLGQLERHRALCAKLADKPWLVEHVEALVGRDEADLSKKTIGEKRKYACLL